MQIQFLLATSGVCPTQNKRLPAQSEEQKSLASNRNEDSPEVSLCHFKSSGPARFFFFFPFNPLFVSQSHIFSLLSLSILTLMCLRALPPPTQGNFSYSQGVTGDRRRNSDAVNRSLILPTSLPALVLFSPHTTASRPRLEDSDLFQSLAHIMLPRALPF